MAASFAAVADAIHPAALGSPASVVLEAMSGERRWLRELAARFLAQSHIETVGELIARGDAELFGPENQQLRQALIAALTELGTPPTAASVSAPQGIDPARLGRGDRPALEAWAKDRGVDRHLAQPVRDLLGTDDFYFLFHLTRRHDATIEELLLFDATGSRIVEIKRTAVARLEALARRVARGRAYEASHPSPRAKDEARAAVVLDPLRALRQKLRAFAHPCDPEDLPAKRRLRYTLGGRSPSITFDAENDQPIGADAARWKVKIPLELHAPLDADCSEHHGPCDHKLAAVDEILRALTADPPPAQLEAMIGLADVPAWLRAIQDLEAMATQPAAAAEVEISWWLRTASYAQTALLPVVRKRSKRGEWGAPKVVRASTLVTTLLDEIDRRPAELLALAERTGMPSSALPVLLESLIGHPRLVTGPELETAARYAIELHDARVELTREGEAIRVALTAGGRPCTPHAARDVSVDDERRRVVVARIDKTVRATYERVIDAVRKVPHDELPAFAARLALMSPEVPVDATELVPVEELPPREDWFLRLATRDDRAVEAMLEVRPLEGGARYVAGRPPVRALAPVGRDRLMAARRDLEVEQREVQRRWETWGIEAPSSDPHQVVDGDDALRLIAAIRTEPLDTTVEWTTRPIKVLPQVRSRALRLDFTSGTDWFGVEGEVAIDEHRATLAMLLDAARRKSDFVQIGEGSWIELESSLSEKLRALEPHVRKVRNRLELGELSAPALNEVLAAAAPPARWAEIAKKARNAAEITPEVPPDLQASLRPYQREGFVWMARLASWATGGVLADDMGLGKTVQAIALLLRRASEGPALVIAPTSVTHNWRRELARFAPSLRVRGLRDGPLEELRAGDVIVTSYGLVVSDALELARKRFATLILDEAQVIKNAASQRSKAVRGIDAALKMALTGTPLENHLGDLWALFAVVAPGLLGTWDQFRDRWVGVPRSELDGLRQVVRPFILRRTKGEVLSELPPKTEVVVDVELSPRERTLYEDARIAASAELRGMGAELGRADGRFHVLAALTRLRQLACDASLVVEGDVPPSSKLARFVELASSLVEEGHSALAFSQFTRLLDRAEAALVAAKLPYSRLDGSTPAEKRGDIVERFQAGAPSILLVSLKAGGTGLNLTAADHVFHLDPWWNPAVEDQATDRAHRIGQSKAVTVFRMVSRGTIESAILGLHASKRDLAARILDGTGDPSAITVDALLELLGESDPATRGGR